MKEIDHEEVKDYVKRLKEAGLVHGALAQTGRDFGISRCGVHWIITNGQTSSVQGWWDDSRIDWTKSNQEIGKLMGKKPTLVQQARLRHGKPSKRTITYSY